MIGFNDKRQSEPPPPRRQTALEKAQDAELRRELARAVSAIAEQRRNAALVATDEEALDLHGQWLISALRQRGSMQVELYLPSSTEALIGRFNALLADTPLEQARQTGVQDGPLRVWVLHANRDSELRDARLLLRLITEFPGAQVRALLLFETSACAGLDLDSLGPRLHRWMIGPPASTAQPEGTPLRRPETPRQAPAHEPMLAPAQAPSADKLDMAWHHRTWAERRARLMQQPAQQPPVGPARPWSRLTTAPARVVGAAAALRQAVIAWAARQLAAVQGLRARLRPAP